MTMSLFHLNNQSINHSIQQSNRHGWGGKESRGKKSKQANKQASKQASKKATTHSHNQPLQPSNRPTKHAATPMITTSFNTYKINCGKKQ